MTSWAEIRGSLEEHASADSARHRFQRVEQLVGVVGLDVDDHVADLGVGLQVLAGDVDVRVRQRLIDGGQQPGFVAVDVQPL